MAVVLNDAEIEVLITGCEVVKAILPMFQPNSPAMVAAIDAKVDELIPNYI